MASRREFLKTMAGGLVVAGSGLVLPRGARAADVGPPGLPSGDLEASLLDALPGKKPLIKRTFRAPN